MARRSSLKPKKKEGPKIDPKDFCCLNCKHAYLMRSQSCNPIVAECTKTKERFVAKTPQIDNCAFEMRVGEMVIHEMIFLT